MREFLEDVKECETLRDLFDEAEAFPSAFGNPWEDSVYDYLCPDGQGSITDREGDTIIYFELLPESLELWQDYRNFWEAKENREEQQRLEDKYDDVYLSDFLSVAKNLKIKTL